ncbi:MAG: prepilin-type N-terminal cleavage/methylation domain-containing protein [Candidatus Pacebacteria bacterium]|nr:prepilin-type N-terminal cleavage/methylation domain-containing protein [Candidatus Paceibacterota bacterium]
MHKKHQNYGFTLVETLVTIFVFLILMSGASLLFKEIYSGSSQKNLALNNIDQARLAEFNFINEVRDATPGNDGSYPVNQADNSTLVLYTSYGASGNAVNRVRYYVSGATLYKGVIIPSGNPLTYNSASEKITAVQSALANGNVPVFYYYDSNYAGTSSPLVPPINLNQVKYVQINLVISSQDQRNGTTTFSVQAGSTIRSLKTNLGN